MKVTLINPPIREGRPPEAFPLGAAYIASSIQDEGYSLKVLDIDGYRYTKEDVIRKIDTFLDNDVVAVGGLITTYNYIKWLVDLIREKGFDKKIIIGGGIATAASDILFKNLKIDYTVTGEGEITIKDLLKAISKNENIEEVAGIYFKKNGTVKQTKPREFIKDIDSIAFPAWELFSPAYFYTPDREKFIKSGSMLRICSSRGCPYQCNFCYHIFGYKYRFRSTDSIIKEIKTAKEIYSDIKHVNFVDDCFVIKKDRVYKFCEKVKSEKLNITWSCFGRANICDEKLLKTMKEAGCVYIGYGAESGSQKILDIIKKNVSVEKMVKAINTTKKLGINTTPTLMIGMIGEDKTTIKETIAFARKTRIHPALFYATPYPGTPLYEQAKELGKIKYSKEKLTEILSDKDVDTLTVNLTDFADEELIKIKNKAEAKIRRLSFDEKLRVFYNKVKKGVRPRQSLS